VKGNEEMRTIILLAVLFASLLLVNSVAFATTPACTSNCYDYSCYTVTGTGVDSSNSFTQDWYICWNTYPLPVLCNNGIEIVQLTWFDQGLNDQATGYASNQGVYMTFHGYENGAFNGLYYDGLYRYRLHAVEEPCAFVVD